MLNKPDFRLASAATFPCSLMHTLKLCMAPRQTCPFMTSGQTSVRIVAMVLKSTPRWTTSISASTAIEQPSQETDSFCGFNKKSNVDLYLLWNLLSPKSPLACMAFRNSATKTGQEEALGFPLGSKPPKPPCHFLVVCRLDGRTRCYKRCS